MIPIGVTRYDSNTAPLGSNSLKPSQFEVVERKRRVTRARDSEAFRVEDYPLAGKEDSDLRHFAN